MNPDPWERCAELEAQVSRLSDELGEFRLRQAFGRTPSQARMLLTMYRVYPRYASRLALEACLMRRDHAAETRSNNLQCHMSRIRSELGPKTIQTVGEFGMAALGYKLTAKGHTLVAEVLEA